MRGHEGGRGRRGSRSERKRGTAEIRDTAAVAADHVKGMALAGSGTLRAAAEVNRPGQAGIRVSAAGHQQGHQRGAWSFLRISMGNCEERKRVS